MLEIFHAVCNEIFHNLLVHVLCIHTTCSSKFLLHNLQIMLECFCASLLCCFGILASLGKFRDVSLTTELNTR